MTDFLATSAMTAPASGNGGFGTDESPRASYTLRVNGVERPVADAWIGESLLYVLRERLGLAGAKGGCDQGECGACSVQLDGQLTAACLIPAALAADSEIRTVEGLADDGTASDVQRALAGSGAVQCGYCVPGLAMAVHDLLERNHQPTELESREALCGNLCRCTGYRGALAAVQAVAQSRAEQAEADAEPDESTAPVAEQQSPQPPASGLPLPKQSASEPLPSEQLPFEPQPSGVPQAAEEPSAVGPGQPPHPEQQPYPAGPAGYPEPGYPADQGYPGGPPYPGEQPFTGDQFPGEQFSGDPFTGEQPFPGGPFTGEQPFPEPQFAGHGHGQAHGQAQSHSQSQGHGQAQSQGHGYGGQAPYVELPQQQGPPEDRPQPQGPPEDRPQPQYEYQPTTGVYPDAAGYGADPGTYAVPHQQTPAAPEAGA
ncbi:2Fe-2S iron-sulfur cluster-binding protein [Streptacidiphilus sp. PB12-B1b]|uniref:(2Fe-2S)-binding protein n=1 Tax=Streptacidiphilus sp. PB12-B1b TaxID=2705012 RepID=UPI00351A7707